MEDDNRIAHLGVLRREIGRLAVGVDSKAPTEPSDSGRFGRIDELPSTPLDRVVSLTERSARPPSPSPSPSPSPGEPQEIARAFAAIANALDAALADLQSVLRSRLTESARVTLERADRIERAIWVAACFCSGGAGAVLGAIAGAASVLWALR